MAAPDSTSATIYILCDSREDDPIARVRYVGRTIWPLWRRLRAHRRMATHGGVTRTACWMRSVYQNGGDVLIEPIATVTIEACDAAEIAAIAHHRDLGCRLTNHTDGGGGMFNADAETRAKIGAASRARGSQHWVGRKHTLEARAKMSAAGLGKPMHPNTRAALYSRDTRAKQAETMREKTLSPEELLRKQEIARRVLHTPEAQAKIRRAFNTPEHRAAISARQSTPESKERLRLNGLRTKGHKMTEEWCQQRAAYARLHRHSEDTKQRMSEWQRGESGPRAKLTWEQVREIRAAHGSSQHVTNRQLADKYSVSPSTIGFIISRKTWIE